MSRNPHNGSVEKHRVWRWRNTECKHIMRWCGPSPAVFVSNPFMTRTIDHHSFDPVGSTHTVEKWHYAAHLDHLQWLSEWGKRNTASFVNQPVVIGKNGGISCSKSWTLLNHKWLSAWTHDPMRYVISLWWCKIFHKGDIFEQLENFDKLWNFLHWENLRIFSQGQCQVFAIVKIFPHKKYLHAQTAYVHAIMTPYVSCNRVACKVLIQHTVSTDMYHSSATPPWTCLQWWYMSTPQHPGHAYQNGHL